ncbi:DUF6893 family small protein [Nonomuraea mangrovi]|uniref:DUF6893 family small protein n=1 Tax=Nonomuraea mangrovi TaxID=2316207 RepID=A0ABW4TFA0_9ACTN
MPPSWFATWCATWPYRNDKEGSTMFKRVLIAMTVAGIGVLVWQSLPDIKRYLEIREM